MSAEAEQSAVVIVELDVFSGRPNPSWELRDGQAQTLIRMLEDMGRTAEQRPACHAPDLGYRGLKLTVTTRSQPPAKWGVFDGCVEHGGKTFGDESRSIEAFVFSSMPDRLAAELGAVLPRLPR